MPELPLNPWRLVGPARRCRRLATGLLLAAALAATALPAAAQFARLKVGGVQQSTIQLHFVGGRWEADSFRLRGFNFDFTLFGLWLDPDPGLHAQFQATNLTGAPLSFSLSLEVPVTTPVTVLSNSATLQFLSSVDAGAPGVQLTPVNTKLLQAYALAPDQSTRTDLLVGTGGVVTLTGGPGEPPSFSAASQLTLNPPPVALGSELAFNLSAFDSVTLDSLVLQNMTAVPEPAAALLFAAGLAGLAGGRRRACGAFRAV